MGVRSDRFAEAFEASALIVLILYSVLVVDTWVLPFPLAQFGIVPRSWEGLPGVVLSPLLHANWQHLTANASSLLVLLTFLFWDHRYRPEETLAGLWIGSGLGTWLIGRGDAVHIGASAIIYGLMVYLIVAAFWVRSWRCFFIALVVLIFYGGLLHGIFPRDGVVSWEAHLSGACVGFLVARHQHR